LTLLPGQPPQGAICRAQNPSFPKELSGLRHERSGLFQTAGLLEQELFQMFGLRRPTTSQTKIGKKSGAMLNQSLPALLVRLDHVSRNTQLDTDICQQGIDNFQWILGWKTIVDPHESQLIGKSQAVVGAVRLMDFSDIFRIEPGYLE
jgi:hypothetical protein